MIVSCSQQYYMNYDCFLFSAVFSPSYSLPDTVTAMAPKPTGIYLTKLRALMKSRVHVSNALQAYIIPTGDAHQVCLGFCCSFEFSGWNWTQVFDDPE